MPANIFIGFIFFLLVIPRISTGMKVADVSGVIIRWHEEILHLFSEALSSLLQSLFRSLSFSAILSRLGFQSFHYGIVNTSFCRIIGSAEKQVSRITADYTFLWYQAIIYGPHDIHIADQISFLALLSILARSGNIIFFW